MRRGLLLAVLFVGCAADEGEDPGQSESSGAHDDGTGPAAPVHIEGVLIDFVAASTVPGIEVCVHEHPDVPCTQTNAFGFYELDGVPANTDTALVFQHPAFMPTALWLNTGPQDLAISQGIISVELAALFGIALQEPFAADRGHVALAASTFGVVFGLDPVSGTGPAYLDALGILRLDLPFTSPLGLGGFANVEPGPLEVSATIAGMPCLLEPRAIPGNAPGRAVVEILPGHFSAVAGGFICY